ncbi:MAG TPA: hypothetical protein VH062_05735 [Polyangiaceae bacterium]|nr:hypothetical protein [Polyangiaceae bacterium]
MRRFFTGLCARARPAGIVALALAAHASGCSRTGLDVPERTTHAGTTHSVDGGGFSVVDAGTPSSDAAPPSTTTPPVVEVPKTHRCEPVPETCNGRDDDCNGHVDDAIAPVPCSGGGSRYCVAGSLTACPTRCDACVPGSERVCFHAYCTYWAVQECTADGKAFGTCREQLVPTECAGVADKHQESPELEQCCIDSGYCCHDEFDLDHDGDRSEMLGTCDEVTCRP